MSTPVTAMRTDVELAPFTTLRLGGAARRFVAVSTADALVDAVDGSDDPVLLLAGGSNLVIADAGFDGLAVRLVSNEVRVDGDTLYADAGADWDRVVADAVAAGLGGLECLSGIPGSVGATPVQNVGAYGVELADLLLDVDLYDRRARTVRTVPAAELGLAYRTSVLKARADAVVLGVRLAVRTDGTSAPIRYAELAGVLGVEPGSRVPTARAREAVLGLRRGKGMVLDATDHDTWSAGSFFTNPVLPDVEADAVLARIASLVGDVPVPRYPGGVGATKLSAAWLIERAGFRRGHAGPGGRVALSSKHTLALTNRGGASTADLLTLAREVRDGVTDAFGIVLHPEPVLVNCTL